MSSSDFIVMLILSVTFLLALLIRRQSNRINELEEDIIVLKQTQQYTIDSLYDQLEDARSREAKRARMNQILSEEEIQEIFEPALKDPSDKKGKAPQATDIIDDILGG